MKLQAPNSKVQITFEYLGQIRTLNKHPEIQRQLNTGEITDTAARQTAWYLRVRLGDKRETFKLPADDAAAIKQAKEHLKSKDTTEFSEFLKERAAKRACTLQELAIEWLANGLPDSAGHPRKEESTVSLSAFLEKALKWWGEKSPASVTPVMMRAYATARRNECRENGRGTGDRSVDVELGALSCLCDWSLSLGKIAANPFATRPKFQRAKDVSHCHEFAPDSDEQWHQILNWFFTFEYNRSETRHSKLPASNSKLRQQDDEYTLRLRICGAWLAFTGLTGIRPEEPQFLHRFQELTEAPGNPSKLAPGTVFVTRTGEKKMRVQRGKNGQNPFVTVTPVLQDFLDHWTRWLDSYLPTSNSAFARHLFPDPQDQGTSIFDNGDFTPLIRRLTDACDALKISRMKPKGFGRAYYVRVRRSQGMDDSIIASELGQTTNGKLIRDTYGNPDDMAGGALFDWLPEIKVGQTCRSAGVPAWHLLTEATAANVIAGKF
jgi:hypothetical protein